MNQEKLNLFKKSIDLIIDTDALISSFKTHTPTSIRINPNKRIFIA